MRKGKIMKAMYIMIAFGTMLLLGAGSGIYYSYFESEFVKEIPGSADLMPECLKVNGQNVVKLGMKGDDLMSIRENIYLDEFRSCYEEITNVNELFIDNIHYSLSIEYINSLKPLRFLDLYIEFNDLNEMISKRDGFLKGLQLKYGNPTNSYTTYSIYCSNEPVLVWKKDIGVICVMYKPSIYDNITEGDCKPKCFTFIITILHPDIPKTEWFGLTESDANKEIYEGVPAMSIFSDWPPPSEVPEPIFR